MNGDGVEFLADDNSAPDGVKSLGKPPTEPYYIADVAEPPVRIIDAEAVGVPVAASPTRPSKPRPPKPGAERSAADARPRGWAGVWWTIGSVAEWLFGIATLMVALALLAGVPIVQLLSLGYLLEASGRVSRSGRIRDAFLGVRRAARVGGVVLGAWLMILPLRLASDFWYSSHLIDPDSGVTAGWRVGLLLLTGAMLVHIGMAWFCGGRLRNYFWPLFAPLFAVLSLAGKLRWSDWFPLARIYTEVRRGRVYARSRDAVWDFVAGCRLPHLFWLGLRGFAGAVAWLFIPIFLLTISSVLPPGPAVLSGLLGAFLLTLVILYLPFLQTYFAERNELVAIFDIGEVRSRFRRAPIAFWFALLITLLFAIPLYLLKIEATPREVVWLPSLVFVAFIFPARVLAGWAMGRASLREQPRFFLFRWMSRLAALPVVMSYVGIVYLTQYLSWYGVWSLFEQHAFLTPVPFLGL